MQVFSCSVDYLAIESLLYLLGTVLPDIGNTARANDKRAVAARSLFSKAMLSGGQEIVDIIASMREGTDVEDIMPSVFRALATCDSRL